MSRTEGVQSVSSFPRKASVPGSENVKAYYEKKTRCNKIPPGGVLLVKNRD